MAGVLPRDQRLLRSRLVREPSFRNHFAGDVQVPDRERFWVRKGPELPRLLGRDTCSFRDPLPTPRADRPVDVLVHHLLVVQDGLLRGGILLDQACGRVDLGREGHLREGVLGLLIFPAERPGGLVHDKILALRRLGAARFKFPRQILVELLIAGRFLWLQVIDLSLLGIRIHCPRRNKNRGLPLHRRGWGLPAGRYHNASDKCQ